MNTLIHPIRLAILLALIAIGPTHAMLAQDVTGPQAATQNEEMVVDAHPLRPPDLSSPRDTLQSFLGNVGLTLEYGLQAPQNLRHLTALKSALEALDFGTTPNNEAFSSRAERMILLKELLDRIELPSPAEIPGDEEVEKEGITEWTLPDTSITISRVENGPKKGKFLFSSATVQHLDEFYRLARNLPYKSTSSTPGLYEEYLDSPGTLRQFDRRFRNRLKRINPLSPRACLFGFLESMNNAYQIVVSANSALRAEPPWMTMEAALEEESVARNVVERAIAALDLSHVPEAYRRKYGLETAIYLKEVMDRGLPPLLDSVPDIRMVQAARKRGVRPIRWRYPNTEIEIVEVTEGDRQGQFLFSAATVNRAREFFKKVRDLPYREKFIAPDVEKYFWTAQTKGLYDFYVSSTGHSVSQAHFLGRLVNSLPAWTKTIYGGQTVWRWIILFLSVLITAVFCIAVFRLNQRLARRLKPPLDNWVLLLAPALVALIVLRVIEFLDYGIDLTGRVLTVVTVLGNAIVAGLVIWVVIRFLRAISETIVASPRMMERPYDAGIVRLTARVLSFVLGGLILLYSLRYLGVDMVPLLAGLGVGGLAVALAAQRTFANFIGSLILFANKPVRVGDFCRYGDQIGTVEHIGMLATRIRSLERTVITVPNAEFSEMKLDNFEMRDMRLLKTILQLRYETTPEQMRYILARLRELLLRHPKVTPEPARVRFVGFGAYSKDLEVFAYLYCQDQDTFLAIQEDIFLQMEDIVNEAGSGFAFPSQTAYLLRDKGIDEARSSRAEIQVRRWRRDGNLPFPEFSGEQRESMNDTLHYPPKGSPDFKASETPSEDEGMGSYYFVANDIFDLPAFVGKLRETNRLSKYIVGRLTGGTRTLLARYQGGLDEALQDGLVQDLNAIIDGPSIYDETRFRDIELRPETRELLNMDPQGEDLERLNRLLLEDAFKKALLKKLEVGAD
jgi:MscS family membrane protein